MPIEQFYRASSKEEAVRFMREGKGRGRFVAGGTDLLCEEDPADFVVDVRNLFRYVKVEGDEVVLGASARVSDLEMSDELRQADGALLASCAAQFASPQIRNMATVGGNLASAVPSADLAPPLLVLGARCIVIGADGTREVPLEEFFTGPRASVLGGDLLAEVRFPRVPDGARSSYHKLGRVKGDIATVCAAAYVELDGGKCREARVALGAAAPTPFRAAEAEASLAGKPIDGKSVVEAAALAAAAARPITDQRGGADFRREICRVLVERALRDCAEGGRNR